VGKESSPDNDVC